MSISTSELVHPEQFVNVNGRVEGGKGTTLRTREGKPCVVITLDKKIRQFHFMQGSYFLFIYLFMIVTER